MAGLHAGRIVFRYPRDGAGRLYCYAQVWGAAMVRGWAGGYGYDKRSAAVESAVGRLDMEPDTKPAAPHIKAWKAAMAGPGGERWSRRLEMAGYQVICIID